MNIDEYFDQIYVINLDSRPDRWVNVKRQFECVNINNYKRFSAIKLQQSDLSKYASITYDRFAKTSLDYILGSMGCKLSHLYIIREAQERDYDKILILEDDILINENIGVIFEKVTEQIKEWDMLYLGGLYRYGGFFSDGSKWEQEPFSKNLQKLRGAMRTCSYGLSKNIYSTILNNAMQSGQEIDIFYYSMHQFRKDYSYYGVVPELIATNANNSDIR